MLFSMSHSEKRRWCFEQNPNAIAHFFLQVGTLMKLELRAKPYYMKAKASISLLQFIAGACGGS